MKVQEFMGKIWGKSKKADILVGVCYRLSSLDKEAHETLYKHLGEISHC